ncbi:MAG: regulatory protein RecX [Armatimonadota bacterium]|nr:recombination regulator RecX [bacterium]
MSTITAIEPQKRREDRRSVFVDGQFLVGTHADIVEILGLKVGQSFDEDRLLELLRAETLRKARESALRLLSYRDRSVSEIRRRLIGSDFPEDVVEEVIDQLIRNELLDDEKFSQAWVKSRNASKPMGKTRLAWELRSKGVDAVKVEEALESIDEVTEFKLALSVAEKKIGKADRSDPGVKNRLGSFLQRRGFGWEVIGRVFNELFSED